MGLFFFFSSRRRHTRYWRDWSSDVCSSDLVIGEGAAVMILESAASVERRGAEPYAKITGVGRTTDAYNITDPDPKGLGILRAMQIAVKYAGLEGEQIGYINPHGTGTVAGDGPESQAMAKINPQVMVTATKSTLGHSMGASGAIETAVCALALKERTIPPMRNLERLAGECADLDYVRSEERRVGKERRSRWLPYH